MAGTHSMVNGRGGSTVIADLTVMIRDIHEHLLYSRRVCEYSQVTCPELSKISMTKKSSLPANTLVAMVQVGSAVNVKMVSSEVVG